MEYELIRTKRKTLAVQVMPGGNVRVRAPKHMSKTEIECFLLNKKDWIFQKQKEQKERVLPKYSSEQKKDMCRLAENKVKPRVDLYAAKMGVTPKSVSVTGAQKQWGSCSSDGRLHFSFMLAQVPLNAVDYVVVHELAHIFEFNHSPAFWEKVKEFLPDYEERRKSLRQLEKTGGKNCEQSDGLSFCVRTSEENRKEKIDRMIQLISAQKTDFEKIHLLMEEAFPKNERRPKKGQRVIFEDSRYNVYLVKDAKEDINGFLAQWKMNGFRYVEHFAIKNTLRGQGLGSKMMAAWLRMENTPAILEVELPETPEAKRRVEFYKRLGFALTPIEYVQPQLFPGEKEISMRIMSWPYSLTEEEFQPWKKELFKTVYGK